MPATPSAHPAACPTDAQSTARRPFTLGAALLAGVALVGCSSDGPATDQPASVVSPTAANPANLGRPDTVLSGFNVRHTAWDELGYRLDWARPLTLLPGSTARHVLATPAAVVVLDSGGGVNFVDARGGAVLWADRYATGSAQYRMPALADGVLLLPTETDLYQIDGATGRLIDRLPFARVMNTGPAASEGRVFSGTSTGLLSVHDRSSKVELRAIQLAGSVTVEPLIIDPTPDQRVCVVATTGGQVGFVDARTHQRVGPDVTLNGGIEAPLATDGTRVFVAGLDQSVYAFDARSGARLWRHRTSTPLRSTPVAVGGAVVLTLPETGLTALNAATGDIVWKNPALTGRVLTTRGGELVVLDGTTLHLVDPKRGDVIRSLNLDGAASIHSDAPADGSIYIISPQNAVLRFAPNT